MVSLNHPIYLFVLISLPFIQAARPAYVGSLSPPAMVAVRTVEPVAQLALSPWVLSKIRIQSGLAQGTDISGQSALVAAGIIPLRID
jgi:hypothetical protein